MTAQALLPVGYPLSTAAELALLSSGMTATPAQRAAQRLAATLLDQIVPPVVDAVADAVARHLAALVLDVIVAAVDRGLLLLPPTDPPSQENP